MTEKVPVRLAGPMLPCEDDPGLTRMTQDMTTPSPAPASGGAGAEQSPAALAIARGVARLLWALDMASLPELTLPDRRRADVAGISRAGAIWIVEIKTSIEDFRADDKWPEYRIFCDQLYFAVAPDFPAAVLPSDAGLIVADRYGGEVLRPAPEHAVAPARRKAVTLRFARGAAERLLMVDDPEGSRRLR